MQVGLEVAFDDNIVVGFGDEATVEDMIVKRFREVASADTEDTLLRIEHEGSVLYAVRSKIVKEADNFEYVDNEDNPINADGSDYVESDTQIVEDIYDIGADYLWILRSAAEGQPLNLSFSDYYLITTGPHNVFEDREDFAIIATA